MRKILSISIKIMIVFQAIYNTNYYIHYLSQIIMSINSKKFGIIDILLSNILPFIIPILLLCIIWIKSNKISEKIINNNEEYIINLNFKEIISILIIVLGIYILLFSINLLVNNICWLINYRINAIKALKTLEIEPDPTYNFDYSGNITNIVSNVIEIIISLLFLLYRRKIIKYFDKI